MRPWLVAAIWVAWFLVATRAGYAPSRSSDRIDDHATRISVWADITTLASMLAALTVALVAPLPVFPDQPLSSLGLGATLVLLGLGLRQWGALSLGRYFTRSVTIRAGHRIVTSGPYRYLRHPSYAGMLVSMVCLALSLGNVLSVVIITVGFFLGNVPRMKAEEAVLEANLGEQYYEFERTHKRLIPGLW